MSSRTGYGAGSGTPPCPTVCGGGGGGGGDGDGDGGGGDGDGGGGDGDGDGGGGGGGVLPSFVIDNSMSRGDVVQEQRVGGRDRSRLDRVDQPGPIDQFRSGGSRSQLCDGVLEVVGRRVQMW
jgi:hypothetical protein